jgi:hypothetical protein
MQHFLASRQGQDIPIRSLAAVGVSCVVLALLLLLGRRCFYYWVDYPTIIYDLCSFLEAYDIRTAYPLLLALMATGVDDTEWLEISDILESYLLRRAICNLGTKNYNRIFLSLTRNLRKDGFSAARLKELLLAQRGESVEWPDHAAFRQQWLHQPVYGRLNSPQLLHLYGRLNRTFMSPKSESVVFAEPPTIEHIMPQNWVTNWTLPDGSKGMDYPERLGAQDTNPRIAASERRDIAIQSLGNLTILSSGLNAAQSNLPWEQKRPEMMKHSLLPINQSLLETTVWDEAAILGRGEELFNRALQIWGR